MAVNLATLLAAFYNPHGSSCCAFGLQTKTSSSTPAARRSRSRTTTPLYFRTIDLEGTETTTLSSSSSVLSSTTTTFLPSQTHPLHNRNNNNARRRHEPPTQRNNNNNNNNEPSHMPTWLAKPKQHLAEKNLSRLQTALRDSYFTENEALKLLFAIEEAAGSDAQKIAGAAEFCLLMVETMELGLDALVAAAFHYCSCVTAREQQSPVLGENFHMTSFGDHVVRVTRDAARLKELELVATRMMLKTKKNNNQQSHPTAQQDAANNLRMLMLSESKDWRALAIRSAACLFRLRGILDSPDWKQLDPEKVRVAREALWIYAPMAGCLGMHRLKSELEGAAFQILYRRQYDLVTSLRMDLVSPDGPTIQQSMNNVLHHVQEEMTVMLQQDEQFSRLAKDFTVSARVKEPYSMWCKMMNHGYKSIREVPDAIALRIVLNAEPETDEEPVETIRARERALCYYAQKLCMERWTPQPENPRFKDYIAHPKPNGYQSLHYTARTTAQDGADEWSLEIQVRSGDMHKVAEFGLASHWDYKTQKKSKATTTSSNNKHESQPAEESSGAYLHKVQQWHWEQAGGAPAERNLHGEVSVDPWLEGDHLDDLWQSRVRAERIRARTRLQPYIEALTNTQSDLTRDYVFVFFEPHGTVLSLPAGACVVDALRKGCQQQQEQQQQDENSPNNKNNNNMASWEQYAAAGTNLNGRQTAVTKRLSNGDVLTLEHYC